MMAPATQPAKWREHMAGDQTQSAGCTEVNATDVIQTLRRTQPAEQHYFNRLMSSAELSADNRGHGALAYAMLSHAICHA